MSAQNSMCCRLTIIALDGRILETGTYKDLIAHSDKFAHLMADTKHLSRRGSANMTSLHENDDTSIESSADEKGK